jgi:prepilin-type N-terminal cleavage/methylation domain-containing protein
MDARSLKEKDIPSLSRHRAVPQSIRSRLACERGFNLVELLVVIPMLAVVLLGMYALYNVGAHAQRQNDRRVTTLLREQNGLERMTREMRQAITFTPVSSQILDAETYVRPSAGGASVERHVRYECLDGACVRYEGPANSAFTTGPETVISSVQNPDVFFFSPDSVNPTYVSVKLEVKVQGANNPIVLDGGFALRNQSGN